MPAYLFYAHLPNGLSETFVSVNLRDDDEARLHALRVLDDHASASHVAVWRGEQKVYTRKRVHPALAAVLGGRTSLDN